MKAVKCCLIGGSILLFSSILFASDPAEITSLEEAEAAIVTLDGKIGKSPTNAVLYVERGDLYFLVHEFDSAEEDYSRAIALDDALDAAYFGRGLAQGRQGFIKEGVDDLSVFIRRNPQSSLAYTKRGVRYIWLGDKKNAYADLSKAVALDPKNAEAHDDLGVVLAQTGRYMEAITHFQATVRLDPSYQKGYHNLAMGYFVTEDSASALAAINNALALAPNARNSMMLKSEILMVMGKVEEAEEVRDEAEFLPQTGDWTEHAPVR